MQLMSDDAMPGGSINEAAHRLHHLAMDLVREFRLLEPEWTSAPDHGALSVSQAFALHELAARGAISQGELGERLRLEKSTVSRMVAGLERRGLVVRERDPRNRRLYQLRLTDAGREAHAGTVVAADATFDRVARTLAPDELAAALRGISALVRVVREEHAGTSQPGDAVPDER